MVPSSAQTCCSACQSTHALQLIFSHLSHDERNSMRAACKAGASSHAMQVKEVETQQGDHAGQNHNGSELTVLRERREHTLTAKKPAHARPLV